MSQLAVQSPATGLQPFLHDLTTCLNSPTVVLSGGDGQVRPLGAHGVFSADIRVLAQALLTVDGREAEPIGTALLDANTADFTAVIRSPGQQVPDPSFWLRRRRTARADGMDEVLEFSNVSEESLHADVELTLAGDLADMETVKRGGQVAPVEPTRNGAGLRLAAGAITAELAAPGADTEIDGTTATVRWSLMIPARGTALLRWSVRVLDPAAVVVGADPARGFTAPVVKADDRRLPAFVARSVADLRALRMSMPATPDDDFVAAGSPWYLTLFGRDSIWAARMLLPLGTDLAEGTLRTLAVRQGIIDDPITAEEPGKILHEIRRAKPSVDEMFLPPVYYGTVDATPLWVALLADAWRWGLSPEKVEELLPAAERALDWMVDHGDSDGDGFLEYVDRSGRGLTNQGWKDSSDSVRFADGRIAVGPVALAEVQSYAYEAALGGADLLDAFGRQGAGRWRGYAADLQRRFREKFWTTDDLGPYPVLALDGSKVRVDAPASNMGHLLASGILSTSEAALVAQRLVHPTMSSGFGLRTMSRTAGGYSPLSYHCGSVWPHDTAIAIHGLMRAGFPREATVLADGLLAAGAAFDGRLPELFAGFSRAEMPVPVPYPASCRPQAWSAASAVVLLQTYLGLSVDVPAGSVALAPAGDIGALEVSGLQIGAHRLDVAVDSDGIVVSATCDAAVHIRTPDAAALRDRDGRSVLR